MSPSLRRIFPARMAYQNIEAIADQMTPEQAIAALEPSPRPADLDPRWDWVEVHTYGEAGPRYVRGACNHLELIPIHDVSGELVARLCLTCDQQHTIPVEIRWTG